MVTVRGPDALTYLHSQVSQDLRDLGVGGARWSFVLEPTGKIVGFTRIVRDGEESFRLVTDPGAGEALLARIDRFRIRVRAETSLVPAVAPIAAEAEQARVRAGWPRTGVDLEPGRTLPAETGLTGIAVNFTKGCYPGQELVERMESRAAEAPRSLRRLEVADGSVPGDDVLDEHGEVVGSITSVAGTAAIVSVKRGVDVGRPLDPDPAPSD